MNRLQKLNRIMQELEHNGDVSEMEYATYKKLLDVVDAADEYSDVIQNQFENGVRCLNENAENKFFENYTDLAQWMVKLANTVAALEDEK